LLEEFPACVVNIGEARFAPGAFNIVPERAELALEFRSVESGELERLEAALLAQAQSAAGSFGLGLEPNLLGRQAPALMHPQAQAAILASAQELGLSTLRLASGAGHDAQLLAELCPSGMLFIPSQPGGSHSPREFSEWQDCLNGAQVLLGAALRMAHACERQGI
jgi:beta-ureidopropionase / N-carbamoyl-L-amino-acid hydrolase